MKKFFALTCIVCFSIATYAQYQSKYQTSQFAVASNSTADGLPINQQSVGAIPPTIVIIAAVLLATTFTCMANQVTTASDLAFQVNLEEFKKLQLSTLD